MANVVKRVDIKTLYDKYSYDIAFDKGGVTIITGPNGYGKTTVLNIIKNAIDFELNFFCELLFSSITIYFSDAKLVIKRSQQKMIDDYADESDSHLLKVTFYQGDNRRALERYTMDAAQNKMRKLKRRTVSEGSFYDRYFFDEYFPDMEPRQKLRNYGMFVSDKNCLFIKEQRILSTDSTDEDAEEYTITKLAEDLKRRYSQQKSNYTDKGQKIDSTFIERLISKKHLEYDAAEYEKKASELNRYVEDYKKVGLISNFDFIGTYTEKFKNVLSLYLEDMFEKINVYEKFYNQLRLFDKFVNGKGLSNKKMVLNEKDGFCFETDSGNIVPLQKLSSGEQNLVILYYRLVFETTPNTLLLIDEPENSLHVEWLEKMLSDYLEMASDLKCQMIIATHSPTFIHRNWNIAYDLYGGSYQDWMK